MVTYPLTKESAGGTIYSSRWNLLIDAITDELTGHDHDGITQAGGGKGKKVDWANIANKSIINAEVAAAAAIAYSKLSLTGLIKNTDIETAAGIPYSKLNLAGNILDADIKAGANIDPTKILISGAITLANWRHSTDPAKIRPDRIYDEAFLTDTQHGTRGASLHHPYPIETAGIAANQVTYDKMAIKIQTKAEAIITNASGEATITFPTAFPVAPVVVCNVLGNNVYYCKPVSITATGFTVRVIQTDHLHGAGTLVTAIGHTHTNPTTGTPSATVGIVSSMSGLSCPAGHGSCVVSFATGAAASSGHTHSVGATGSAGANIAISGSVASATLPALASTAITILWIAIYTP